MGASEFVPPECPVCHAVMGHEPACAARARTQLARATRALEEIRQLHQPVDVPAIPGTSLDSFTRCSCTPGLLFADCPTAKVVAS